MLQRSAKQRGQDLRRLQVLKELYDGEVLSEEAILQWADEKAEATDGGARIPNQGGAARTVAEDSGVG